MPCSFCKNVNHRDPLAYGHFLKNKKGETTCPRLLLTPCQKCGIPGHTRRYCKTTKIQKKIYNIKPALDEILHNSYVTYMINKEPRDKEEEELQSKLHMQSIRDFMYKEDQKITELIKKRMIEDKINKKMEKMSLENNSNPSSDEEIQKQIEDLEEESIKYCKYCKDFDENDLFYKTHITYNDEGKTICPRLLSWKCKYCNQKGHTPKYCEKKEIDEEDARVKEYLKENPNDPHIIVFEPEDFESDSE